MRNFNTIVSVDKLILSYKIYNAILDQQYLDKFYDKKLDRYSINKFTYYEIKNDKEKELKTAKHIKVFKDELCLGTLFYDNIDRSVFYFKIHKDLFLQEEITIKQIIKFSLEFFPLNYRINNITRIEIAADTSGLVGSDLIVIQDLCTSNAYFSFSSKVDLESIKEFDGRGINDAKYSLCHGKLKTTMDTEYGTVYIGNYKNWKFIRSYKKSSHSTTKQKLHFNNKFGEYLDVYRIEVSLNNKGCRKEKINYNKLDDNDYLTYLYKKISNDYLTFNDLRAPHKNVNGNKVYPKIRLVEKLKFENPGNYSDNSKFDFSFESKNNSLSEIRKNRSRLTILLRKYLNNPSISELELIHDFLKNNPITSSNNEANVRQAMEQVKNLVKKFKDFSPEALSSLLISIYNMSDINNSIQISKSVVTNYKKVIDGKLFLHIVKIEDL